MAKIIIEIKDLPEGTDINLKDDPPATDAKDKTGAQQTAMLVSKIIQTAQMMASPVRRH